MIQYKRKVHIVAEKLEDHLVMLDTEKGKYYSLNTVAVRIWELLEKPQSLDELCTILTKEFEVEPEQCQKEVKEHLAQMQKLELVEKVDQNSE